MNQTKASKSAAPYDDEIDLGELARVLWQGKSLIGAITLSLLVIGIIVALLMPNIYRAEALLAPNDQEGGGGVSTLAAQYGGLASLAGINIGAGAADKAALGIETLKSRRFISKFIESHDILVPLMAAKGWDAESGIIKIDSDKYDVVAKKWIRNVSPPKSIVPSMQEAYKEFQKKLLVSQDKRSGFIRVSVDHVSPTIAKKWVDWLVEDVNATIMKQDVAEAEQAIEYLNEQIKSTSLADLQNVFFRLIEEQTKTVMLANMSPEYVFRTLDPAVAPELKNKPRRLMIMALSMLIGVISGMLFVLLRHRASPKKMQVEVNTSA